MNLCATPPQVESTACDTCLEGLLTSDPCVTDTFSACEADPTCAAYLACGDACPAM
jgi:hypothetical protein